MQKKSKPIPKIPYGKQDLTKSDIKAVIKALDSDLITQGPLIQKFESDLKNYTKAKYAVVFSSGTTAMHAACLAAGLSDKHEGITTPITFAASANCMLYTGATLRLADIEHDTAQLSWQKIKKHITKKTKMIVAVDLAGRPVDLQEISFECQKRGIFILRDACHSFGGSFKKSKRANFKKVGSCVYADMTSFSFHPVKPITTGEGGAITTNNFDIYKKLLKFRHHGITKNKDDFVNSEFSDLGWYHEIQDLGYNYRLTDFQCALGISQLQRLDKNLFKRQKLVKTYLKKLQGHVDFIKADDDLNISGHHIFPVLFKSQNRNQIYRFLLKNQILTQLHYIPLYRQPYYKTRFAFKNSDFPNAESYFYKALTLPLFANLKPKDQNRVIETLLDFLKK